jgi:hypothetical protein
MAKRDYDQYKKKINTPSHAKTAGEEEELESKKNHACNMLTFIDLLKKYVGDVNEYLLKTVRCKDPKKKKSAAVLLLDDMCNLGVGITPFKYWVGRTYTANDALTIAEKFNLVRVVYTKQLQERTNDEDTIHRIERLFATMQKIMGPLFTVGKMAKSQQKFDEIREMQFVRSVVEFNDVSETGFPDRDPWWK